MGVLSSRVYARDVCHITRFPQTLQLPCPVFQDWIIGRNCLLTKVYWEPEATGRKGKNGIGGAGYIKILKDIAIRN